MIIAPAKSAVGLGSPVRPRPFAALMAVLTANRARRDLARLDPHLLRDIGLTDADVTRELSRPFWDAPSHWFR